MLEAGDTPYVICGDFNINPQQSPALAGLIAKGILVDVPHAYGLGGQHTFCHHAKGPPKEGVEEKGRTRIDTILANKAAFPLIKECRCRWDILLSDHVPIEIVMDIQRYGGEVKEAKLQHPFPKVKWTAKNRKEKEEQRNEEWNKAWNKYERRFNQAEQKQEVEEMHRLRCKAAVQMLKAITETEGLGKFSKAEKRAQVATFCGEKSAMQHQQGRKPHNQ